MRGAEVHTDADRARALEVARDLVALGVPLFLAQPDEAEPTGFRLPGRWQWATPDPSVVDAWQPGMALCAVMGHALDLIDLDPRSGGVLPVTGLTPMAVAATPSGGRHLFVLPLGVASRDGVWPGVDVKAGAPDGSGRGFAFIAPTVRRSKEDGQPYPYVWGDLVPDVARIRDALNYARTHDHHGAASIRRRISELRAERAPDGLPRRLPQSVARAEWDRAYARLVVDLQRWSTTGWGGEAHAGLLAHTTHLARLSPENAPAAFDAAFAAVGLAPDSADMLKLETAIEAAVPDVVIPDADMPPQEAFWAGATVDTGPPDVGGGAPGPRSAGPEYDRAGGKFRFLTEYELLRIQPPDPLVEGLLWSSTVARIFGPSTVGKTWTVLDLAAHVANGLPWQGRPVKQAPTLYVAAEGSPGIGPRMEAWSDFHGRPTAVRFWPEPVAIGGQHWAEFTQACADDGYGLIVLDTQAAMTIGRKENDNDDANLVLDALRSLIVATGACVLSVHHNGWAEDGRARGASSTFNGLDTELQLSEGRGKREAVLFQRKQRYAELGTPSRIRMAPHAGQLVVLGADEQRGTGTDAFFGGDGPEVRARAIYERLVAWEAAGGAVPPKMGMRDMRRLVKEELNEAAAHGALDEAIRMFKRAKGLPVSVGTEEYEE